ncbi:transcriptional regulator [Paenibacillus agilis]|uniref:Transcriptional regulator n=1 Tax=Paenibacillus agilis TaxID=3020863 RepID=A0A559IZK8_9BACL|nr:transcriptional regulator [Paenibacillus agilis]TVX93065.1 transcriptional regulator [Paenibacillus agilis]
MDEKKGTPATRAKNKYNAANYDRLYPYAPKGRKEVYEAAATKAGYSLNEYIIKSIEEKIERDENKCNKKEPQE